MNKREYYIKALNAGAYRFKRWVIECFGVMDQLTPHASRDHPYALHRDAKGYYVIEEGKEVRIDAGGPVKEGEPFLKPLDPLHLDNGDLANVYGPIDTFYGNALVNATMLIYPFGGKIPFMTGRLDAKKLEKKIEPMLVSGDITTEEYLRYADTDEAVRGWSMIFVASSARNMLTADPEVLALRDRLIQENADKLDDPLVQAHISDLVTKADRERMKGTSAERFYLKSKSYDVVRKRLHGFVGQEQGFGRKGKFITKSLAEGWDMSQFSAMANSQRDGSHTRGAKTALGGVGTKNNYRIFQNTVVLPGDCGTKLGLPLNLTKDMIPYWLGFYVIEPDGALTELTTENLSAYTDKDIVVRSTAFCHGERQNVCSICVGKRIASTPNAIPTYASDLGSLFLSLFLASVHGRALKSHRFEYADYLS